MTVTAGNGSFIPIPVILPQNLLCSPQLWKVLFGLTKRNRYSIKTEFSRFVTNLQHLLAHDVFINFNTRGFEQKTYLIFIEKLQ